MLGVGGTNIEVIPQFFLLFFIFFGDNWMVLVTVVEPHS